MASKRFSKSKFNPEDDIMNSSQCLKKSPRPKKSSLKRQRDSTPTDEDADMPKFSKTQQPKRISMNLGNDYGKEHKQKLLNVMSEHIDERKEVNDNFIHVISEILEQFETDNQAMKDNEQKLEQLMVAFMKSLKQSTFAQKQKVHALKEAFTDFHKQCEKLDSAQKVRADKAASEMEEEILRLQEKLIRENRRSGWEACQKSILAMQTNF